MKRYWRAIVSILSLSWRLFARNVGAKYRKSFLGYFWMVGPAIFITAGVTLANHAGIINPGATVLPYPMFVLFGILMWHVFVEAFEVPHQAFDGARSYLTRVNFRREAIILSQFLETLVTAAVRAALALALAIAVYGPDIRAAFLIVTCFAGTLLVGLGLGAILMPFTMLFEDLQRTLKLALAFGLFLTPAMYQPAEGSLFALVVKLNPVWPFMDSAREAVAGVALSNPHALAVALGCSVTLTVLGFLMVRATAPIVIERMLLGGR